MQEHLTEIISLKRKEAEAGISSADANLEVIADRIRKIIDSDDFMKMTILRKCDSDDNFDSSDFDGFAH